MTGSTFFNKQTQEIALSSDHWHVNILDFHQIRFNLLRLLIFLKSLLRSELWYQTGGITRWKIELLCWIAFALGVPHVVQWIGSDVVQARTYLEKRPQFLKMPSHIFHWAEAPWLVEELKQIGIKAEFVPRTSIKRKHYLSIEPPEFPRQFTVLTYIPERRPEFYGWENILKLAEDFPEITFNIVRATGRFTNKKLSNLNFLGWVDDMFETYKNSTVVVRMTKHDGYSGSIQEPLALGRYAIWTYPFPGAMEARDYPTLRSHVASLLNLHQKGLLMINEEGRQFIKQNLNPDILARNLERGLQQCARRTR